MKIKRTLIWWAAKTKTEADRENTRDWMNRKFTQLQIEQIECWNLVNYRRRKKITHTAHSKWSGQSKWLPSQKLHSHCKSNKGKFPTLGIFVRTTKKTQQSCLFSSARVCQNIATVCNSQNAWSGRRFFFLFFDRMTLIQTKIINEPKTMLTKQSCTYSVCSHRESHYSLFTTHTSW